MEALKISMSGLNVEWQRIQVIAQNLANINSTRDAVGNVYRPQRLLSGPDVSFNELVNSDATPTKPSGVRVMDVADMPNGVRTTFEPNHPHADVNGMLASPNVDHAAEMTLMIKSSRVYEANLTAMSIVQQMYTRALEMGRG